MQRECKESVMEDEGTGDGDGGGKEDREPGDGEGLVMVMGLEVSSECARVALSIMNT